MTVTIYCEPTSPKSKPIASGSDALNVLQSVFGYDEIFLSEADFVKLEVMVACGHSWAGEIIEMIEEHGEVEIEWQR